MENTQKRGLSHSWIKKTVMLAMALLLGLISFFLFNSIKANADMSKLSTSGKNIVNANGDTVHLKGVNAGGLFETEHFMNNTPYSTWRDMLDTTNGNGSDQANTWEGNYWSDADFQNIQDLGFNTIRLPFNYMNLINYSKYKNNLNTSNLSDIMDDDSNAFSKMDSFISKANDHNLYVVLDMHGAFGSQNGNDHSGDTSQGANLINNENNKSLTTQLWNRIAAHYSSWSNVAGYDLLNEPENANSNYDGNGQSAWGSVWDFYNDLYQDIRKNDSNHMIIMESCWDPVDLPDPSQYGWSNIVYEYHEYPSVNSDSQDQGYWNQMVSDLKTANYNVPTYIGEFSLARNNYTSGTGEWKYALDDFNNNGYSWTVWNYRAKASAANWGLYSEDDQDNVDATSSDFGKPVNQKLDTNISSALEDAAKAQ